MIYENSRYINTPCKKDSAKSTFKIRDMSNVSTVGSTSYTFKAGDSLPALAYQYYGDYSMWWVLVQVNNKKLPTDFIEGDIIIVPSYKEVMKVYG